MAKSLIDNIKSTMTVSASQDKQALLAQFLTDNNLTFENISQLFFYLLDLVMKAPTLSVSKEGEMIVSEEKFNSLLKKEADYDRLSADLDRSQEQLNLTLLEINRRVNVNTMLPYPTVRDFVIEKARAGAQDPALEVSDHDILLVVVDAFANDIKKASENVTPA